MLIVKKNLIVVFSMVFVLITIPFNFFYNYMKVKGFFPAIPGVGYPVFGHLCFFCF